MKKLLVLVLVLAVFSAAGFAQVQKIVELRINISKEGTASVEEMLARQGIALDEEQQSAGSEYRAVLLSRDGKKLWEYYFDVSFLLLADNAIEVEDETKTLYIPFYEDAGKIQIFFGESLLKEVGLEQLCNSDGECSGFESATSCPQDCSAESPDKTCVAAADGACDPDCFEGIDADCTEKPNGQQGIPVEWIAGITAAVVAALAAFFVMRRRK